MTTYEGNTPTVQNNQYQHKIRFDSYIQNVGETEKKLLHMFLFVRNP